MANILKSTLAFTKRHPIIRGMISYGTLWPTACFIQQKIEGKSWEDIDWKVCRRFAIYGSLVTAPLFYGWVKITTQILPCNSLKSAVTKALVEQITYGPISMSCFFIGMNFLEGNSFEEAKEELKTKFWPTFKVALCFWPIFQTFNFAFVPERNRVIAGSCGSLVWVVFLAYMKKLHLERLEKEASSVVK